MRRAARSGCPEALACVREIGCDLVLLDVVAPDKEGAETLGALQHDSPPPRLVVMLGADEPELHVPVEKQLGASGILTKPFAKDELLGAVASALE